MTVTVGLPGNCRGTLKKGLTNCWECESESHNYGDIWSTLELCKLMAQCAVEVDWEEAI